MKKPMQPYPKIADKKTTKTKAQKMSIMLTSHFPLFAFDSQPSCEHRTLIVGGYVVACMGTPIPGVAEEL